MIEKLKESISYLNVIVENLRQPYVHTTISSAYNENIVIGLGGEGIEKIKNIIINQGIQKIWEKINNSLFNISEELQNHIIEVIKLDDLQKDVQIQNRINEYFYNLDGYKFLITNGNMLSVIMDSPRYHAIPLERNIGITYPMGTINDIEIFCNPYMLWSDNRVLLGNEKIELKIDPNIIWNSIEEFKVIKKNRKSDNPYPELDPFNEEIWNTITEDDLEKIGRISMEFKCRIYFNESKFKILSIGSMYI